MELRDISALRLAKREGRPLPDGGVVHVFQAPPKAYEDNPRKFRFCFSDGTVDRAGDSIAPEGWDWSDFAKNPVVLWAHDSFSPPIGRVDVRNMAVENGRLMGDVEFMAADIYPFAETICRMVRGGYISAVSVGFIPREYAFVEEQDRPWGIDFKRQELVEISLVPVPCNANALAEARAKGINTAPLLDWACRVAGITRKELAEDLRPTGPIISTVTELRSQLAGMRRGADGMNEGDPAAGGVAVGACGTCCRAADEECGMKDPQECSIHRSEEPMADKELLAAISQAVKEGVREGIKAATRNIPNARRRADGEDPPQDDMPADQKAMRRALKALGAVRNLGGEVSDVVDELQDIVDQLDDAAGGGGGGEEDPPPSDDPEEKARRAAAARRRRALGM